MPQSNGETRTLREWLFTQLCRLGPSADNENYTTAQLTVRETKFVIELLDAALLASAPAGNVVAGERMERSLADFTRACEVQILDEQRSPACDTALIGVLCDAVRLAREYAALAAPTPPPDATEHGGCIRCDKATHRRCATQGCQRFDRHDDAPPDAERGETELRQALAECGLVAGAKVAEIQRGLRIGVTPALRLQRIVKALESESRPSPAVEAAKGKQARMTGDEIMRLAAISTASIQNTETSVAERIGPGHPYYTVAYGDVCRAVDREMRITDLEGK